MPSFIFLGRRKIMSISFADSLKKAQESEKITAVPLAEASTADASIAVLDISAPAAYNNGIAMLAEEEDMIAAYAGDDWTLDSKYLYYPEYHDDVISSIDSEKNITLDSRQINITQETNSQYIPFQMPRFYDGFDLKSTNILIHFLNKDGYDDYAVPVNVYWCSDKIKFAWLVDKRVTAIAGTVQFEIQAVGVNSKGDEYIWMTKPCDGLNVLQSLSGNGVIEPDTSWVSSFITQVTEQVAIAQEAANEAKEAAAGMQNIADEAQASANEAKQIVETAKSELEASVDTAVNNAVTEALSNYYTEDEVDTLIANIDISDQLNEVKQQIESIDGLANFDVQYDGSIMTFYNGQTVIKEIEINSDPSAEWTSVYTANIESKIADAKNEVQTSLDDYKTVTDADLADIHSTIDNLPTTLTNDYYNKVDADNKFATKSEVSALNVSVGALNTSVETNKTNISTLSEKVVEFEETIATVDTSPRLTYDIAYNDVENPDVGENGLVLYEITHEGDSEKEERVVKNKVIITGGGGGSASGSVLKIGYVTTSPLVVTTDDKAVIQYTFSGTDSSGDSVPEGTATWKVAGRVVATSTALAGENSFDITEYIGIGTQKITLSISDESGSMVTKTWTVQKIDVRIESEFNDKLTYPIGTVSVDFTPYGAVSKSIHFVLDGKEVAVVTTASSGIPMGYDLAAQQHGSHLLEIYMTANINGNDIESNHIFKDILWYDSQSTVPVIGTVYQNFTARQYDATNIEYTVYDPTTETPTVEIAVDGVVVSTPTLESATNIYTYKTDVVGAHTITIKCGETVKTLKAEITKLDIEVNPVTTGLVFDFNPSGKSNNDADRVWSTDTVAMTVSDNFDWVNGGYQYDENGDQYFCIKAGTSAEINYQLFADDAKKNGKEFKLVFKTTNVAKPDATFLSCMDNTTETDHIGIQMDVHEANIYGQAGSLQLPYSEEDIIEFEFNISKNTEAIPMVMGYEDGVSTRPMVYDDSYNFTQNTPKVISLGSEDCDLHIYRFKVYNTSLTKRDNLTNFIADARNAEEMVNRYDRNQIYNENSQLDPDILAEKCPWLRVYKISAPYFTNNKSDKVPNTTIQQIYKGGDPVLDNWTCYNCSHSGQGTSSNNYGAAGRNLDFIMNKSQIEGVKPYFKLGDGTETDKITLTRTSVPVAYLNAKVNIASSNNMTNAMLANRYNEFNPYNRPFIRVADLSDVYSDEEIAAMTEDERIAKLAALQATVDAETAYIKDTMEFHNCVIFIQETDKDTSTHREFADNDWHFYAIGNIGDSKKTDSSRLTDMDDKYECCVEIMDVELPLSDFPVNTMYNAMGYKVDEKTEEKIYIWAKNENLGILYELIDGEYVLTQDTEVDLTKTYYVDILEHDDFSEDFTYGWRYIYEGDDDNENAEVFDYCKQKWIELYRFITTSTDEEFRAGIGNYVVLDSILYYYLFTTRYCMVDNRAKNLFFHYGKTNEVDSDGNPIRKWDLNWGYDMD